MTNEVEMRWLVYRPVQMYDDCTTLYIICDTELKAKELIQELHEWLKYFAAKLPDMRALGQDVFNDTLNEYISEYPPPYGLDSSIIRSIDYASNTVEGVVAEYIPVPYVFSQGEY